jgi:hypothetical protein
VRIRTGYRPFTLRVDPTPTAAVRPNRFGPANMPVPFDNGSRGENHESSGDPAFSADPGNEPPPPEDIPPPPDPDAVE